MLSAVSSGDVSDALLVSTIPGVDDLAERLRVEGAFGDVRVLHRGDAFIDTKSYHANYFALRLCRRRANEALGFLREYRNVRLFNDYTEVGAWLNASHIPYTLLEDGLDCYKVTDQYMAHGKARGVKRFLHDRLGIPLGLAQGAMLRGVEVNDAANLATRFSCPVREVPRRDLAGGVTPEQVRSLFRAFDASELLDVRPGSVLILTGPLWDLGVVDGVEQNLRLHAAMARLFPGSDCYVKPHPRDVGDYAEYFPESRIISKDIPIELLNYIGVNRFEAAVTWCSTSIYQLTACRRHVVCDPRNTRTDVEHACLELEGVL